MREIALVQRFLPSRSRGGVGHFTDGLARALSARGHRVTILSEDPAPAGAPYAVEIVRARGVREGSRLAPILFPFALDRVDFRRFDVIHAQGDEQVLRGHHPPVVRTLHGTALAEAWFNGVRAGSPRRFLLHGYFYAGELLADLRADAVVAVSRHTARFYPRVHHVIPNGIDVAALAPDGTPKHAHPVILFIGEIDSRKRGRLLVDVFTKTVRPRVPGAELWLISPDRAQGDGIRCFGSVDDAALATLLRAAWVMCLPSAYEGFGRPYAEAMAAGTAVVASPNAGAREVLADGRFGAIAGDAALGETLVRVLTSAAERGQLERAGLERAAEFSWDRVSAAYEAVYEDVLGRRAR